MMTLIDLKRFPCFVTCREWTEKLIEEESVLVFPGEPCFNYLRQLFPNRHDGS